VAGDSGADSIFQFWLEMGGDDAKYCRKMKQSQRAHFDSIGKKCDTA
jgi:hypothetical protein